MAVYHPTHYTPLAAEKLIKQAHSNGYHQKQVRPEAMTHTRRASLKESTPTGRIMNSCMASALPAWLPPLMMLKAGTGSTCASERVDFDVCHHCRCRMSCALLTLVGVCKG